ncbi:MAG TPA: phage holin family protein [Candidatus Eisenbergiella merdipullorum]|uniref:Phage holin family protein n=1 Tax=Candidatus Eisenbergiella merdipullorum TaxID=2838553 RepID=A0A9D2KZ26_9FIRM|nr:phage holin family protein [Candidatus Eisenbergiella merdipullorum]
MDITTLGTCVAIVAICYVVGMACKAAQKIPDEWIPVIMAVVGGVLGAVGMNIMPDFPAADYINAVAVGAVSGLAATGVNQVYKQAKK